MAWRGARAAGRRRVRRRPADGDAQTPSPHDARAPHAAGLLGTYERGRHLRRRAGRRRGADLHPRASGGLGGTHRQDRPGPDRGGSHRPPRGDGLRVRLERIRRERELAPARCRDGRGKYPHGAVWPNRLRATALYRDPPAELSLPRPMANRLSQIFVQREHEFFDLFEEAAGNILRSVELLERMLRTYPEHGDLARDI